MNDYANQARNFVCGEPQQVMIVFDSILSRKASRYFIADKQERDNILAELNGRNAIYFIGDDRTNKSVKAAYDEAIKFLEDNTLYTCCDDSEVKTFDEVYIKTKNKK